MMITAKRIALFVSSVGLFTILAGCSTVGEKMSGLGSIFSEKSDSTGVAEVYYTRSPDLPLYQSPGGVIVRRLPQHTKLTRDKLEKGYAHVRISSTGVTGWVENGQLVWRLPQDATAGPTQQAASQPTAEPLKQSVAETSAPQTGPVVEAPPAPTPSPPQATTVPASAPATESAKPSVAPSIFNPY